MSDDSRLLALTTLKSIHQGAFADVAVDKTLSQSALSPLDRRLLTELVYGCVRRQRTLDAVIDQLGKKKASQQPADLRLILHLGLYQLRYLNHIPASAAVNTTVELAKHRGFAGLTGVVNGLLRQYLRLTEAGSDPLQLPDDPVQRLGMLHSYPDWIVQVWLEQFGMEDADRLCQWMNQPPAIDLRVNLLRASVEAVEAAMAEAGVPVSRVDGIPAALRLQEHVGAVNQLPGYDQGWWMVQDSSAQLVGYLVQPQPGQVLLDACAAPGGKAIHLAELMQDQGVIWACDRTASRLKRLQQNCDRLGIQSVQICTGDSRDLPQFVGQGDRVLLDAPCSGLGTLHRHADARWRQTPASVEELALLQRRLLEHTASWLKPVGKLVYATCTLHPAENEAVIQDFLAHHSDWEIEPPAPTSPAAAFATPAGWVKTLPHHHNMDGFFMVKLKRK